MNVAITVGSINNIYYNPLTLGLISTALSVLPEKRWLEMAYQACYVNSKFNLCTIKEHRKWEMLLNTEHMLCFASSSLWYLP